MEATKENRVQKRPGRRLLRQTMRFIAMIVLIVAVSFGAFTYLYRRYNDRMLYAERLSQMHDVTAQLFSGLEDVVGNQWSAVNVLSNYIELAQPSDMEALQQFMAQQAALNELDTALDNLLAVDNFGRYYTEDGAKGTLQELDYLLDDPARISYVSNTVTTNRTKMVFLKRLTEPVKLAEGQELVYYGCTMDMGDLEPYFNCAAYEGSSVVYVTDRSGLKLFSSQSSNLIHGYNLYNVLAEMEYLHGTSFDAAHEELDANGLVYSNAVLDGEEYFYSMYRMESAEWTLVFLVNAKAVAMNTVALVNTTVYAITAFAVLMIAVCATLIFLLQRRQQAAELALAAQSNAALEKVNADLADAVAVAEKATQEAEAANHAKSDFLANMSHDIRTPMNAIVGITNLMEHEAGTSEKLRDYIHKVQASSRHLLSLINDVLDMSKIESSEVTLNVDSIRLAEQVAQVDSIIRSQTNEHGQTFRIYVHEIVHEYLLGDGMRLRQIFLNLLSNAVKYTPYGGSIRFDLAELPCKQDGHASFRFSVTDNGYGMDADLVAHIFEPFTRGEDSVTNKIQGTGLGMAITKNIVDLMGGQIRVDSLPGRGSRFDVDLTFPVDPDAQYNIGVQRTLLISDDEMLVRNMSASFHLAELQFRTVRTVDEASALLAQEHFELVMLSGYLQNDLLQPAIRRLRAQAKGAQLLFCVDYAQPEQVQDALIRASADGLIQRPFFLSSLENALEHMLAKQDDEAGRNVLNGMRLLCAEDNVLNTEILRALLEMAGATCTICPDGQSVVDLFEQTEPGEFDAILMDVQMPRMNGYEATRAIRTGKNPAGKTIPIIAMTANAFSDDVRRSMAAGMDAHISKPVDMATLEKTLKSFCTPPPESATGVRLFVRTNTFFRTPPSRP